VDGDTTAHIYCMQTKEENLSRETQLHTTTVTGQNKKTSVEETQLHSTTASRQNKKTSVEDTLPHTSTASR
jgi:hypothetical protein